LSVNPTPDPTPPDEPDETPAGDEPDEPDEPASSVPAQDPGPRPEWGLLGFVVHRLLTDSAALRRALAFVAVVGTFGIAGLVAILAFLVELARIGNLAIVGTIYAIVFGWIGRLLWQWRRRRGELPRFPGRARLNRMFLDGSDR
jgi:hypothetical protein